MQLVLNNNFIITILEFNCYGNNIEIIFDLNNNSFNYIIQQLQLNYNNWKIIINNIEMINSSNNFQITELSKNFNNPKIVSLSLISKE